MVGPWIHALWKRGKKLSDIEYLSIKEFDSKLRTNEGSVVSTTGDLATLTATAGKDMYLAKAKISAEFIPAGATNDTLIVELKVNGVITETYRGQATHSGSGAALHSDSYEFVNIGQKVLATEIIKLEVITNQNNNWRIEGTIVCFEEDTGASPAIS